MPHNYTFITAPDQAESHQIMVLYREAGWWDPDDDANAELVRRLVLGSHCFLVVRQDDTIIGMGRAISDGVNDAYLQDITVLADYRHQGLGSQIVEKIVERLHQDGLKWIGLIAGSDSHPFYRNLGFAEMPFSTPMLLQDIVKA